MSHIDDLNYRLNMGFITEREFDRQYEDAVYEDYMDRLDYEAEREKEYQEELDKQYNEYLHEEYKKYVQSLAATKGGHTHNHIYNKCHKHIFRSKQARKNVDHKDKPEFVRIFHMNLKLGNYSFDKLLHTIFHHNKKTNH